MLGVRQEISLQYTIRTHKKDVYIVALQSYKATVSPYIVELQVYIVAL